MESGEKRRERERRKHKEKGGEDHPRNRFKNLALVDCDTHRHFVRRRDTDRTTEKRVTVREIKKRKTDKDKRQQPSGVNGRWLQNPNGFNGPLSKTY